MMATITAEQRSQPKTFSFVLESRSGALGSARARNPQYADALELLLERLAGLGGSVLDILVASRTTEHLPEEERRLPLRYPIHLDVSQSPWLLRKNITEVQRGTARTSRAMDGSGGNNNKRIRIFVELPDDEWSLEILVLRLSGRGLAERDARILEMRRGGATLDEIGMAVGVTRERVRQILKGLGGPSSEQIRILQSEARATKLRAHREAIARDLAAHPGSSLDEVAKRISTPREHVETALTPALRSLLRHDQGMSGYGRWPHEEVLDVLKAVAASHGPDATSPLTNAGYSQLREDFGGPSVARIIQMFGSWSEALRRAGLPSGRSMRRRVFEDEDLWEFVVQYLVSPGTQGRSFRGYDDWRRANAPYAASGALIRSRLGPWLRVRAGAWVRAVEAGLVTSTDLLGESQPHVADLAEDDLWAAEQVLQAIEAAGATPRDPTVYDAHCFPGAPSSAALIAAFGTWGLALGALGHDPTALVRTVRRQSDDEALQHLAEYVAECDAAGETPTATGWQRSREQALTMGPWAYVRRFGSWQASVHAARQSP